MARSFGSAPRLDWSDTVARKSKGARGFITLECKTCSSRNYRTSKRLSGGLAKLNLKKFCKRCRSHQEHKERKK